MATGEDGEQHAAVHETHVGVVLLLGDRAYKLKKPVRTSFLDFGTPERRLAALRRELALNRRLAPDVYLGLSRLSAPSATGEPGDDGGAEPLLVMRRMPAARRLSTLVRRGADVDASLRALARLMAAFHARAERGPRIALEGDREALRARWLANTEELRRHEPDLFPAGSADEVDRLVTRFLAGRGPLFAERLADDRIVDGHGDLIAGDVFCLDDGPRVLDCLEFDDHLRFVDALDDVAFLAMDLERLGRPDLGERFLDLYVAFSGDRAPASLRHHYTAYRAGVRAKVACIRHAQGDPDAGAEAAHHLAIALRHLREGAPRLALVGGLPGTGKTTLAGALADRFGAVVLSSDRIRKELAGIDPTRSAAAPFGAGIYAPERTEELYAELVHRAEELLRRGESVVLDASWTSATRRAAAVAVARRTSSELLQLECRADAATTARRIAARRGGPSDATVQVATLMADAADPWPEAVAVDTAGPVEHALERAGHLWRHAAG
ncbi:MAG TPA: AAA family ATPase [Pseudonocardia sp.]|uniref:bifunctional aminoglycoside phosphotransferase/ATP-binding protein n=1 Tax=Pseudonocardia sp. TaxID=60912 RepID=UPI002B4B1EC5|nr:AAA family ATPase [Pseudonocardia sp.]HLU54826.1 AAA family ATPase [Pseudonocardia sp.]